MTSLRLFGRAELGHTGEPAVLVPGDPAGIQRTAGRLTSLGERLTNAGQQLGRVGADTWAAAAADRLGGVFQHEPGRWTAAGDALTAAAAALHGYAATLTWAQGQAREAIALWEQGEAQTRQAMTDHTDAVRAAATAGGAARLAPFHDPGADIRQQARELLGRARARLAEAGDRAAMAVAVVDSRDQTSPRTPQVATLPGPDDRVPGRARDRAPARAVVPLDAGR